MNNSRRPYMNEPSSKLELRSLDKLPEKTFERIETLFREIILFAFVAKTPEIRIPANGPFE